MLRKLRTLILLLILVSVGLTAWRSNQRLNAWEHSIHVAIYPIPADDSPATQAFIDGQQADSFSEISQWLQEESQRYGPPLLQPVIIQLAAPLKSLPPPRPASGSALDNILWSLQLRWWASRNDKISGPKPDVRLFVLFHDPARRPALPHSTGLSKGQLGLIHAFASRQQRKQNAVVIAHELLHTYGATDKYDLASNQPHYPHGYAEPERQPRLPQQFAEIMAGRIPRTAEQAEIPPSLDFTLIGDETAREIGLLPSR